MEALSPHPTNPLVAIREERRREKALEAPLPPGEYNFSPARMTRFIEDPLGLLLEGYEKYGPVFTLRLLTMPMTFLIGPEANHFVLVSGTKHFNWREGGMGELIPLVGNGLLTTDGAYHDSARKIMTPAFARRNIEALAETMLEEADRAIDELPAGREIDVYTWTRDLALGIAMRGLFGLTSQSHVRTETAEAFEAGLGFYYEEIWKQVIRGPLTPWSRMQKARASLDEVVFAEIARRRRSPEGEDILSRMIREVGDDGVGMSDQEVRDHLMTLLFAGHDTTTSTISFMLYELARHPAALQNLVDEIDATLGDAPPSAEHLFGALPLLDATLAETLRMYPAAWYGPRRVTETFELNGVKVSKGLPIFYSSWVTQRLPQLYPDPEAFQPERFLPGGSATDLPKGAYVPFGGGTRICVGKRFGETEIKIILIRLLQRFRPELISGYRMQVRQAPTLSPLNGMPVRMHARARVAAAA